MIDKVVGDSIVFEANLLDGTNVAVSDAVANLVVVDFTGSTVVTTTAPYTSAGTYQKTISTTGWNKGPIIENWKFTNSGGTTSQTVTNGFRIVGTDTIQP